MARKGGNPDIKRYGFKPGDPRINRKGQPRKLPRLDALLADKLGNDDGSPETESEAGLIIETLIARAKKGDTRAAEILLDRGYGKPKQTVHMSGKVDGGGKHVIEFRDNTKRKK